MVWRPPRWTHTHTDKWLLWINITCPLQIQSTQTLCISHWLVCRDSEMKWHGRVRVSRLLYMFYSGAVTCYMSLSATKSYPRVLLGMLGCPSPFMSFAWCVLCLMYYIACVKVDFACYILQRNLYGVRLLLVWAVPVAQAQIVNVHFDADGGKSRMTTILFMTCFCCSFFFVFVSCCECVVSPLVMQYALSLVGAGICDNVTRKAARFEAWCLTIANDGLMMHWIIAKYKTYWDSSNFHDWCQQTLLSMLCEYLSEC